MKKNFLNIALLVTALVALVTLVVFFVKLDKISRDGKDSKTGNEKSEGDKAVILPADDNNDKTGVLTDNSGEKGDKELAEALKATPTPSPSPTPSPVPSPTASPTPEPVSAGYIDPEKPIVALSFDDGPSSNTKSILDTLEKYGAHATFFMVGENVDMHPDWVKMVYDSGNEVANHTINHKNLNKLSAAEISSEVEGNQDKLNKALGLERKYLVRPPYGNANDTVKATIEHPMILWWVDTLDWSSKDPDAILAEVKKSTKDGAIILMHDLYSTTADAVKLVVPWLKEQGYQLCSVSEMFAARGAKMENGKTYNSCISAEKYKEKQNAQ